MALSAKDKYKLDIAMGSKADADELVAAIESSAQISDELLKKLEIAMGDKKAAAEMAASILGVQSDDQDAIDAAQTDVDDAQAAVDAAQTDVDDAQAALDLDPENETLQQDLADAQAALVVAQDALADAQAVLDAAKAADVANNVSSRTEKAVMTTALASKEAAASLKADIEE